MRNFEFFIGYASALASVQTSKEYIKPSLTSKGHSACKADLEFNEGFNSVILQTTTKQ